MGRRPRACSSFFQTVISRTGLSCRLTLLPLLFCICTCFCPRVWREGADSSLWGGCETASAASFLGTLSCVDGQGRGRVEGTAFPGSVHSARVLHIIPGCGSSSWACVGKTECALGNRACPRGCHHGDGTTVTSSLPHSNLGGGNHSYVHFPDE